MCGYHLWMNHTPQGGVNYWIGGKEVGTASVLRELVKEMVGGQEADDRSAKEMLAAVMNRLVVTVPVSGTVKSENEHM